MLIDGAQSLNRMPKVLLEDHVGGRERFHFPFQLGHLREQVQFNLDEPFVPTIKSESGSSSSRTTILLKRSPEKGKPIQG